MLIAFGGYPGTGKTTLARALAGRLPFVYLRIDTIEQTLLSSGVLGNDVGPSGYLVAYALAAENLRVGRSIIADSVNPLRMTRASWAEIAREAKVPLIEVEIISSEESETGRGVEQRTSDIKGHFVPTWETVQHLQFEPWSTPHIVLDTAGKAIGKALDELQNLILEATRQHR